MYGVLFEISESEKAQLDIAEGLHHGYEEKMVEVLTTAGRVSAVVYYAMVIDGEVRPYEWYKRYVVDGAIEHGLPEDYVRLLKSVDAIADPDPDRHKRETRIVEGT